MICKSSEALALSAPPSKPPLTIIPMYGAYTYIHISDASC